MFVYASDHGISKKWSLYEPGLRVPLIVKWPKVVVSNIRTDVRVSLIDILPTFLDVANQDIPKNMYGKSFYNFQEIAEDLISLEILEVANSAQEIKDIWKKQLSFASDKILEKTEGYLKQRQGSSSRAFEYLPL